MTPKHCPDLARPSRRIGFGQNLLFELACIGSPLRTSQNLRIRTRRFALARRNITQSRISDLLIWVKSIW